MYLIADDYITGANAPKGKDGSSLSFDWSGNYYVGFNMIVYDYEGASWISQNSKGAKWLSQFLSSYGTSTNNNIKAVAYMMDTNVWSEYYAGEDAEYAMGGPTLEMFCASYKDTHQSNYIECGNVNSNGYQVRGGNGGSWGYSQVSLVIDDYNSIYIKSDTSKSFTMCLASPSAYDSDYLMQAKSSYNGSVEFVDYSSKNSGLRPIVCLKSGVQLEKQADGTFMIVK